MEPTGFDRLVRAATRSGSRRALGLALAGALLPMAATAASEPARCLAAGKRCRPSAAADARHGKGKHRLPACRTCCSGAGAADANGKIRCACDAIVCPDGCCDPARQACQPGTSNDVCGSGGATCQPCVGSAVCQGGACACPGGGEAVHGGCFTTCDPNQPMCPTGCLSCFGGVAAADQFLCANPTDTSCATSADCPAGQACWQTAKCIAPC